MSQRSRSLKTARTSIVSSGGMLTPLHRLCGGQWTSHAASFLTGIHCWQMNIWRTAACTTRSERRSHRGYRRDPRAKERYRPRGHGNAVGIGTTSPNDGEIWSVRLSNQRPGSPPQESPYMMERQRDERTKCSPPISKPYPSTATRTVAHRRTPQRPDVGDDLRKAGQNAHTLKTAHGDSRTIEYR
jgi:hypothetical protein